MHQVQDIVRFITGGNAIFTIRNEKTGNRYTYKVTKPKYPIPWYWIYVLNGSDNESNYIFLGSFTLKDGYRHSPKSYVTQDAKSVIVIDWYIRKLLAQKLPPEVVTYHEGKCARCGRKLTVPESISSGFGPECITRVFDNHVNVMSML